MTIGSIGVAIGVIAGLMVARVLSSLVFGVDVRDPAIYVKTPSPSLRKCESHLSIMKSSDGFEPIVKYPLCPNAKKRFLRRVPVIPSKPVLPDIPIQDFGDGTFGLTVPIEFTFTTSVSGIPASLHMSGSIAGTATP